MFNCRLEPALELRLWDHSHADELYAAVDRNRAHLRQWLPWADTSTDVEATRSFITRALEQFGRNDGFHAGIWLDGRIVGGIGLVYIKWSSRRTEIGYWLAEDAQRRGIITRACGRLIDYLFDDLKLNRIEIRCAVENQRSRGVAQRLRFTQEGLLRQVERLHDRYVDHAVYAMLAHEWKHVRPAGGFAR